MRNFILLVLIFITTPSIVFAKDDCDARWKNHKFQNKLSSTYRDIQNNCDQNLKDRLHIISKRNQVALTYPKARVWLQHRLDNNNGEVCSVYSPHECKRFSEKKGGFNLNIEHTWPQSKGAKLMPAKTDMHHLFITSKATNSKRANLDFCNVASEFWEYGGSKMGINDNIEECFEPHKDQKGNAARAMFYVSVRYHYALSDEVEAVLRGWHKQDPVTKREIKRNKQIIELQGNTNPFIEYPELIELITNF